MADIPGDPTTTAVVSIGSTTQGAIDSLGDHDWYAVTLAYGQTITITVAGDLGLDTYVNVYDPTGKTILASNDNIGTGGNTDSRLTFTPTAAGTYYIDVGAAHDQSTGAYDLFVELPSLSVWSYDQIATQLTNYYWGGDVHHWKVTQGGTLTVDIHTLNSSEQTLALAALQDWTDLTGIHFQQVTSGAQISFSDVEDASGPVAQTSTIWSNGVISSANIQISQSWVSNYGTSLDSYSFQTYVHEIGHALGLGHAGEYNLNATYTTDALYANDGWSTTVMSYFSQHENYYLNNLGFSQDFVLTPMIADLLAVQQLYGLATDTRTGDTTYGYNSNTDNPVFNASLYPNAAYLIYDNGGNDTLDYSKATANQLINLNPETFSNVNGQTGNVMIAPGVVIENAIGGSGDDTIIQNAANNVLNGGAGNDTLSYETAAAGVSVNLSLSTAQDTGGAGTDTISGFENLIGSAFNDILTGGPTTVSISGGAGDDVINAGTANPTTRLTLSGGDGNDTFLIGTDVGPFVIDGGTGFNTVDGSNASGGLLLDTNYEAPGGIDILTNIQKIVGSNYADTLIGGSGTILIGGAGDDSLTSFQGNAQLAGGTGNDTYFVTGSSDQIIENPGEGTDTVNAAGNYTLGANLENLTLHEYIPWDPYAGAAITPMPSEDWTATGNNLANVITGNLGNNVLTGLGGADTLTGGGGNDTFMDTADGHNGDTITDFSPGDTIVISDASISSFNISRVGNTFTYTGGSITIDGMIDAKLIASANASGGVQLIKINSAHDDFNGDGKSDILWRSDSGALTDWFGTATGGFTDNSAHAFTAAVDNGWQIVGTGDFNGDGRVDVLFRNSNGVTTDWLANADGSFTDNSTHALSGAADNSWQVVGTGDFNGDGTADILWRNSSGYLTEWRGTSGGGFTDNGAAAANGSADNSWQIVATGDFNGDGKDDILWRNSTGYLTEWLGTSTGGFTDNAANAATGAADSSWQVVGSGDFNGDGIADILWRNSSSGYLTEWLGTSTGGFTDNAAHAATGAADNSWQIAQIGDFNGDGRSDILWRNASGYVTEWLGTATGGFSDNAAIAATGAADNSWHVQEPFI